MTDHNIMLENQLALPPNLPENNPPSLLNRDRAKLILQYR